MKKFIGRLEELNQLNALTRKQSASIAVIKGRRRIGKSRLIQEFCKDKKVINFAGLPPTKKTTSKDQRNEFKWQLEQQASVKADSSENWNDLFFALAEYAQN
jgi:AAA+ ATPase superfamily predicted ATPase